jgi:hypothetical protein
VTGKARAERSQNAEGRKSPHSKSLPEDWGREMMEQQLMTAQILVHDLNREAILSQAVPEILSQPVREIGSRLLPKVLQQPVEVIERS